jgi:hypothetical protein
MVARRHRLQGPRAMTIAPSSSGSRLSLVRTALAGAAVFVVLFAICWAAAAFGGGTFSHMFISLFTGQPVGSQAALFEGLVWSIVFGASTGALVAFFFNLFKAGGR